MRKYTKSEKSHLLALVMLKVKEEVIKRGGFAKVSDREQTEILNSKYDEVFSDAEAILAALRKNDSDDELSNSNPED